ncbi:hypothetical protein RF11_02869 [Thelohanellus kitauei]|uniref:CCHC-type domain-containing protein n=1 Tax=Thelohanellus kitauei TaxID=669202 RepID=A0A0C2IMZ6_THEKT|nr:hypothetical protein RF11_02869 [Thelohanellus kitauei]
MQFNNRKRDESDSVEKYIMTLKTWAAHCEFSGNNDECIRDQFIIGISNGDFQQELEKSCESNHTQSALVVMLTSFNDSTTSTPENPKVFKTFMSKQRVQKRADTERTLCRESDCMNCGHPNHRNKGDCSAKNVECFYCKKTGHFASVCLKRPNDHITSSSKRQQQVSFDIFSDDYPEKQEAPSNNYLQVIGTNDHQFNVNNINESIFLQVKIQNLDVTKKFDSGAAVSCAGKSLLKKIGSPNLEK